MKREMIEKLNNKYVRTFLSLQILAILLYTRGLPIVSLHGLRTRWLLLIVLLCTIINLSMIVNNKQQKSLSCILLSVTFPIFIYEVISLWEYMPAALNICIILLLVIGIICIALLVIKQSKEPIKLKSILIRSVYYLRVLILSVMLLSIICERALIFFNYPVQYSSSVTYVKSSERNNIDDYANSLSANIRTVSKIADGWGALSLEEKIDVLESVVKVECRYLGMTDKTPQISLVYMKDNLLGTYIFEMDTIHLSYQYIVDSKDNGYSILETLCHEMYHRYQYYQINVLHKLNGDSATDLLMFNRIKAYKRERENYYSPLDESDYELYSSQALEADARKYAETAVIDYKEQIEEYLNNINN